MKLSKVEFRDIMARFCITTNICSEQWRKLPNFEGEAIISAKKHRLFLLFEAKDLCSNQG